MKLLKKLIILILIILSILCVYFLKEREKLNNNQDVVSSLTEEEMLQIGQNLYEYAHRVGNCKEFKYSEHYPNVIYNYDEIADNFTTYYIEDKKNKNYWNVFTTIEKDSDGKHIDMSRCGFGLSMAKSSLTSFKLLEYKENYIIFEVIIDYIGTYGVDEGSIVRTETSLFKIKKENNTWKIDYYDFDIITDMLD